MQRLFSMFPMGWAGFALLSLRASVGLGLLLENTAHRPGPSIWITVSSLVVCVALSVGFLTPIAAAVALGLHVLIWLTLSVGESGRDVLVCLDAVALALLGPGAYSLDSYRFGRRVVVRAPP
jgi:putative oxidoreductase